VGEFEVAIRAYQARKSLSWSRGSLETAFSMSSSVLAIVDVSCG